MENLIRQHIERLKKTTTTFIRDIVKQINWNDRLIIIKGARGVGKTTLLLQYLKLMNAKPNEYLYISMDSLYFANNRLFDFAEDFIQKGGRGLFIDEIHKYADWALETKNLYDIYPELKIVITGSSILHIHTGAADLSRRARVYLMNNLSFREFLRLEANETFKTISLEVLLEEHESLAQEICSKIKPLLHFEKYLKYGCYPFFLEDIEGYSDRLSATVNQTLEVELPLLKNLPVAKITKLKKLLYVVSHSVPFSPNTTKLSSQLEISRNTLLSYLHYLDEAQIISTLWPDSFTDNLLKRPDKLYLHNTNLMHAIAFENTNTGTSRETFFLNQLKAVSNVTSSKTTDFVIDNKYIFEIGGKNKKFNQVKDIPQSYIATDNIEYGLGKKIPIWLFGFLY